MQKCWRKSWKLWIESHKETAWMELCSSLFPNCRASLLNKQENPPINYLRLVTCATSTQSMWCTEIHWASQTQKQADSKVIWKFNTMSMDVLCKPQNQLTQTNWERLGLRIRRASLKITDRIRTLIAKKKQMPLSRKSKPYSQCQGKTRKSTLSIALMLTKPYIQAIIICRTTKLRL